ncbi:MAG: hypothetical protein NVS2B7_34270 [Herpetosiphon sp.]
MPQPKTNNEPKPDSSAIKIITVRTNTDGWRALKGLALEHEATLNALAIEALNDLLKKYGKRASIENPLAL